jgi:hypothetical protein
MLAADSAQQPCRHACLPTTQALHDTGTIKQPEPLLMQSVTARLDVFLVEAWQVRLALDSAD